MRVALVRRDVAGLQQNAVNDAQSFQYSTAAVAETSLIVGVSAKCTGQAQQR